MKMSEVRVGEVYGIAKVGRNGKRLTGSRVKVDARYVANTFSQRQDRVQVHYVSLDEETGEWNYNGTLDADGNPLRFLVLARELVSLEEIEERNALARTKEEQRQERNRQMAEIQEDHELTLARKLGIAREHISVGISAHEEEDGSYTFTPFRARIEPAGVDQVMAESDVLGHLGVEDISEALRESNYLNDDGTVQGEPHALAEAIVGWFEEQQATDEDEEVE